MEVSLLEPIADVLRQKQVAFGREAEVAAAIIATLSLRAKKVRVEGEWGLGAFDHVEITGSLT